MALGSVQPSDGNFTDCLMKPLMIDIVLIHIELVFDVVTSGILWIVLHKCIWMLDVSRTSGSAFVEPYSAYIVCTQTRK